MKNSFYVKTCFSNVPLKCFEWNKESYISGLKLQRVSTKFINDALLYDLKIKTDEKYLLVSDTKTSIVLLLDNSGTIVSRSFLTFAQDLEISEFANNIKKTQFDYIRNNKKLKYSCTLNEEVEVREKIINVINQENDDENKYIYFLLNKNITNYSKNNLINLVQNEDIVNLNKIIKKLNINE